MLSMETQQRATEALRKIDQSLERDLAHQEAVQKQAHNFREAFFAAFQFIERESLQLNALLIQIKRLDANQIVVQTKGRIPFALSLDPEVAYDIRSKEDVLAGPLELAARLFAVFAPPYHGVFRHYTIFADGTWKRTTFTFSKAGVQTRSMLLQRFSLDILVLEAVEVLGHACLLHPTWLNLDERAESITLDTLRERDQVKRHLTTGGGARRATPTLPENE